MMKHTYNVTGMTCSGCEAKIKHKLLSVPDVLSVEVSKENNRVEIEMEKHIPFSVLKEKIEADNEKYKITESIEKAVITEKETKTWFVTYKPILLIFTYITLSTILIQIFQGEINWMQWMQHFMAGFFLVFSFFKMLNLKAFSESYAMYDVVAKKIPAWGYVYAFIELGLGISYLLGFNPLLTNLLTFIIMSVSIIGVLQSVLNKRKIQCACLGAVFDLPMSTVTIIEDVLMIVMSLIMIISLI